MNKQQLNERQQLEQVQAERIEEFGTKPMNCAPGFWDTYRQRPGAIRRRSLAAFFMRHPRSMLPVNGKWQANMADPDLAALLKKGFLVRLREGGGRLSVRYRTSRKRQTYLALASAVA